MINYSYTYNTRNLHVSYAYATRTKTYNAHTYGESNPYTLLVSYMYITLVYLTATLLKLLTYTSYIYYT